MIDNIFIYGAKGGMDKQKQTSRRKTSIQTASKEKQNRKCFKI